MLSEGKIWWLYNSESLNEKTGSAHESQCSSPMAVYSLYTRGTKNPVELCVSYYKYKL